ncbi:hypothetical protein IRJ41_005823 [Triplophysa rosa]|uniref:Uncharacterized protein n=2 Tax=Triplophysa rosa TaxID=992332 RepID=A0A9W7W890_TRIRA|nr:hypothetical protein IRJ41_005823 [Triplophysa rosa]
MQTPDLEETDHRVVLRNEKFLNILEEVMELNWLHGKTQPEKKELLVKTLPSIASGAVENNDFISLQVLLEQMDVNSGGYDKKTLLHTACQVGNGEMVMFLLDNGASSQSEDRTMSKDKGPQSGQCPMYSAIKNRHFTVIELLRLKGFTVNLLPVRIAMEMIQAVQKRDYALLHAWFLSGVDMDTTDYSKRTAMQEADRLGDNTMISKLLEYGAKPLSYVRQGSSIGYTAE